MNKVNNDIFYSYYYLADTPWSRTGPLSRNWEPVNLSQQDVEGLACLRVQITTVVF